MAHYYENNPYSLSQNSVYKIFEDSQANIWIGTYAGGINFYDRSYDLIRIFRRQLTIQN